VEEEKICKKNYNIRTNVPCHVVDALYEDVSNKVQDKGEAAEEAWNKLFAKYEKAFPEMAEELSLAIKGELPEDWDAELPTFEAGVDEQATRKASSAMINAIAKTVPTLLGGSADLASSNNTMVDGEEDFNRVNYAGRNIWFGVREFAMGAALNGMALHGGLRVYGGTFFLFSDYVRPAIR